VRHDQLEVQARRGGRGLAEQHLLPDAVVAFVDGDLSPPAFDRAATHIARCPYCAAEVAAQRQARAAVQASATPPPPAGLLASLRAIPQVVDPPSPPDDRVPLLTDEEEADLKGVLINRPRGSVLMVEGERTRDAMLILSGHVKVTAGGSNRIVAIRGPGDIIGEMASLTARPRSASAYAVEDVSLFVVSGDDWVEFLSGHPRVCLALLKLMDSRLGETTSKFSQVSSLSVEQRLASALLEIARKLGRNDPRGMAIHGMSQRELAGLIGASRESVAVAMSRFRTHQLVATGRERITVLDAARLREIAETG
jgi:CRP/FNR family cyclic AMP-dependent transcriptional regulator